MDNAITPIEQHQTEFNGDTITAVVAEDGTVYVPLRPICDSLGVAWAAQRTRISRNEVLSQVCEIVTIMTAKRSDTEPPGLLFERTK